MTNVIHVRMQQLAQQEETMRVTKDLPAEQASYSQLHYQTYTESAVLALILAVLTIAHACEVVGAMWRGEPLPKFSLE
jgi:hypothetical protein